MSRVNWARSNVKDRMWRYGTEDRKETEQLFRPKPPRFPRRRPPSKEELRAQAEAAFAAFKAKPRVVDDRPPWDE